MLRSLMIEEKIAFLVITEPFLRPGDPPQGLFQSTYDRPSLGGIKAARRGILISVHPDFAGVTKSAPHLGGGNPNILWIVTTQDGIETFAAGIYWPDNRKKKEADAAARHLLEDIDSIPLGTHIIILGDFNADPFTGRGPNKWALSTLLTNKRLTLIKRPDNTRFTCRTAKYIDNIIISTSLQTQVRSEILYYEPPDHDREPSDHVMIAIRTTLSMHQKRPRLPPVALQYDTRCLREGRGAAYTQMLDVLASEWLTTLAEVRSLIETSNHLLSPKDMEAIWASIKFLVYSASYQTLPTKRMFPKRTGKQYMHTVVLSRANTSKKWDMIRRRLDKRGEEEIPFADLEEEQRKNAGTERKSNKLSTRRWVRLQNRRLDDLTPPTLSKEEFEEVARAHEEVLRRCIRRLKNGTSPGLDQISTLQIKLAPDSFVKVLAFFVAWAGEVCVFPTNLRLARLKQSPRRTRGHSEG